MSERGASEPGAILLTVAYDGAPYCGFAMQESGTTVAGTLLDAARAMDPSVRAVRGVSRTDAGVHARGQLVAFDPSREIPPRGWALGLSSHLPASIAIRSAGVVERGFDPRRHALGKRYRYDLLLDRCRDPFVDRTAWRIGDPLDLDLARDEAASLLGTHDFRAFRSSADERTNTQRTLTSVTVETDGSDGRLVRVEVQGTAFLHNMVRIIVGTLVDVARGRLGAGACERALASGQRTDLGVTAPPHGLCLMSVRLDTEPSLRWPPAGA